jgi:hypothetical protein
MFWREQGPSAIQDSRNDQASSPFLRAIRRKQRPTRQIRTVDSAEPPSAPARETPTDLEATGATPIDLQQLLRRANSLASAARPGTPAADLIQRLEELGPTTEVLEALQEILRRQNTDDVELPQYEERNIQVA